MLLSTHSNILPEPGRGVSAFILSWPFIRICQSHIFGALEPGGVNASSEKLKRSALNPGEENKCEANCAGPSLGALDLAVCELWLRQEGGLDLCGEEGGHLDPRFLLLLSWVSTAYCLLFSS